MATAGPPPGVAVPSPEETLCLRNIKAVVFGEDAGENARLMVNAIKPFVEDVNTTKTMTVGYDNNAERRVYIGEFTAYSMQATYAGAKNDTKWLVRLYYPRDFVNPYQYDGPVYEGSLVYQYDSSIGDFRWRQVARKGVQPNTELRIEDKTCYNVFPMYSLRVGMYRIGDSLPVIEGDVAKVSDGVYKFTSTTNLSTRTQDREDLTLRRIDIGRMMSQQGTHYPTIRNVRDVTDRTCVIEVDEGSGMFTGPATIPPVKLCVFESINIQLYSNTGRYSIEISQKDTARLPDDIVGVCFQQEVGGKVTTYRITSVNDDGTNPQRKLATFEPGSPDTRVDGFPVSFGQIIE